MIKKIFQIAMFLTIGVGCVLAQDKSAPTKVELIARFATLTKANQLNINVQLSLDDVKARMASIIDTDKDLTEPQKQEVRKAAAEIFKSLAQRSEKLLSESDILNKLGEQVVIDVYDKAFTESELTELIAFFGTPLGQKTVDFLSTSKSSISRDFKIRMQSKIEQLSEPLINSSIEELRKRVKAEKEK